MIKEFSEYEISPPYGGGSIQCPNNARTYKADSDIFVFYEDGTPYMASMAKDYDRIEWLRGQWFVKRVCVHNDGAYANSLVSKGWVDTFCRGSTTFGMSWDTFNAVKKKFIKTPMGLEIMSIIEASFCENGYNKYFFDYVYRSPKTPLVLAIKSANKYIKSKGDSDD